MKILNLRGMARVVALLLSLCLSAGLGSPLGHAAERPKFVGEDQVQWEAAWYPLEDGAQQKLLVRRGSSDQGVWVQFRNDYEQPLVCQALVTSRLASGRKFVMLCFPGVAPGEIQVFPPTEGEEITKVKISNLQFKPVEAKPKKPTG